MSFHDMVRAMQELDEIRASIESLGVRLGSAQEQVSSLGAAPVSLGDAVAGLAAAEQGVSRLVAAAGAAEMRLRATVHVPSLRAWHRLAPLVSAFEAHPDWEVEVTVPRAALPELGQVPVPLVAFEDWLVAGLLTDVSLCLKRYDDVTEQQLRDASWSTVLLPLYRVHEAEGYWQILDGEPLPYGAPDGSPGFVAHLAAAPTGRTRVLWCPASYDDFFGSGVDSAEVIELARRQGLLLLWFVDQALSDQLREGEQAYLGEIAAALVEEGTAVMVAPGDLAQAIDEADAFCGGTAELAELFASLGRGVLAKPTDAELDRVRIGLDGAVAQAGALTEAQAAAIVERLRVDFAREFLGTAD